MSFSHYAAIWEMEDIASLEKLVLLALAHHADPAGLCWPSLALLETRTRMSRSSVCRKLALLEKSGRIVRERGRFHKSTRYRLAVAADLARGETCRSLGAVSERDSPPQRLSVVSRRDRDSPTQRPSGVSQGNRDSRTRTPSVVPQRHGGSASVAPEHTNEPVQWNPPQHRSAGAPRPVRGGTGGEGESQRLVRREAAAVTEPVTLDRSVPEEVRRLWAEWCVYRAERHGARGAERLAWTPQAARMSAESIARACERHPARVVADRVRAAIEGRWQGLNLDRLEAPPGRGPGPAAAREGGLRVVRGGGL